MSYLKVVSYSLTHLTVAVSVAYALTRDWQIALGVGLIEPMVQTLAYYIHERLWQSRREVVPVPVQVRRI
jgi:uncharacterized membrane protein